MGKFSRHDTESMKKEVPLGKKIITLKENRNQIKPPAGMINEEVLLDRISRCLKEQRTAMHEQRYKLM